MKTVHFHGVFEEMAKVKEFQFSVKTPLDLFNALKSQIPGFSQYVAEHKIVVVAANEDFSKAEAVQQNGFDQHFSELEHIHVAPAVEGSGIETALIAAGYSAFAAAAITIVANLAISFVVSAIVKALAPSPDTSSGSAEADKRPSFLYNGAKLVGDQGYAIPLIYGTHMHGGFNIGTDIEIQDIPYVPAQIPAPAGSDTSWPVENRGPDLPIESFQGGS
jgi:predicted phage tail protein